MAAALPFVMAGASVIQGVQGYQAGKYQAGVAKQNARIAELNADRAVQTGQIDAQIQDMKLAQVKGETIAAQGASGISVNSASSKQVRQSQQMIGDYDRSQIVSNANVTAYNYRSQAADFRSQAQQAKMQGQNALLAGFINAGTSLMGASSSVGPKWTPMKSSVGYNPTKLSTLY